MKIFLKYAAAVTLAGALAVAVSSPSQARDGRNAAVIGGFAAGAVVGAAVAGSANGYYGEPGYAYREPGYAYAPGYVVESGYGGYAYAPRGYGKGSMSCATQGGYGHKLDYANCY